MMGVAGAKIAYVPTAKSAARRSFLRLAWPSLLILAIFGVTVTRTLYVRLVMMPEAALAQSAEAVWGMIAFASVPVLAAALAIHAAWQARRPAPGAPWDAVDVLRLGGRA
jgi:hypothetical protein